MDLVPIVAQLYLLGLEGLPVWPGGMPLCEGEKAAAYITWENSL